MATVKIAYAADTSITITAGTLANGSARESTAVDNTSNLYDDVTIRVSATLATGTPAAGAFIGVYASFSDDGTHYTDNATGADAALTLRSPTNLPLIGTITTPDAGALTYEKTFTIATFNGGVLPRKWSIIVSNKTGFAFTAFAASYTGITYTVA